MVKIIDDWYFNYDDKQYILIHAYTVEKKDFKTRKGTGEMVEKREECGFFISVTAMLRRLAEFLAKEKISGGQVTTVGEYIAELERIEKRLSEVCKGY